MHYCRPVPHRFFPYRTSLELSRLEKENATVILPLASVEQHGPHLPVFTDSLIVMEVLQRSLALLPEETPIWYLPLLPYGRSVEHFGFAGTISLTSETLHKVLLEIGESLARSGFRRLVILNGHGGNYELVDLAIRDMRQRLGLMVFGLHIFLRIAPPVEGLSADEATYGIHAGDVETSILLKIDRDLVRMDQVPDAMPLGLKQLETPPFLGPLNFAWLTGDISASGAIGNARTADADRGEKYLQEAAKQVAGLLQQATTFKFPALE